MKTTRHPPASRPDSILIVSDDEVYTTSVKTMLAQEGYRVSTASSGMEAVQQAARQGFNLIIIATAAGQNVAVSVDPSVRTIIVADPSAPSAGQVEGVDEVFVKPVAHADLLKAVARSLERSALQKSFEQALQQQWHDFRIVVRGLASALEAQSPFLEGHSLRVAELSRKVGVRMNVPPKRLDLLELASHLHNLGNIHAKLTLLAQTDNQVVESIQSSLESSVARTSDSYDSLTSLREVFRIMLHHHEWYNGEGLPNHLKGEDILLESRILCAVQAFDAMVSPRPYRERLSNMQALTLLESGAGQHFDPQVVAQIRAVVLQPGSGTARADDKAPVHNGPPIEKRRVGLLLSLAQTYLQNGSLDVADKAFADALAVIGDKRVPGRAVALNGRAMVALLRNLPDQAVRPLEEAQVAAHEATPLLAARIECTRALVLVLQNQFDEAEAMLAEAERIFVEWESSADIGRLKLLLVLVGWRRRLAEQKPADDAVRARFAEALTYLQEHDLVALPAYESAFFAPLFLTAFREAWAPGATEPVLSRFGPSTLEKYVSGFKPAEARQLNALLEQDVNALPHQNNPLLSIYAFGKFRIFCQGEEVDDTRWRTRKGKYLFAYLVYNSEQDVLDEKVIDVFWPEHDADKARQNFYSALSHIRRAFEPYLPAGEKVVVASKRFYRINPKLTFTVDVRQFDRFWESANQLQKAGNADEAVTAFERAETLYQGSFLDGCYDDWAIAAREEYERRYHTILSILLNRFVALKRYHVVQDYAQRLLAVDPCSQEAHLHLMQAYVALGRPEQAVRQYDLCCKMLKDELNLSPSAELSNLYLSLRK